MNNMIIDNGFNTTLEGFYKVAVLDENNNTIYEQPNWEHNMILNNGLDQYAVRGGAAIWDHAIMGIGTRPNIIASSGSTAYVSASYLLLTGSGAITSFTSGSHGYGNTLEIGDTIKFDDDAGTEVAVTTIMGADSAGTSPSSSITSGSFVIYKTSQVNLENEIHRTETYLGTGCKTERHRLSSSYNMVRTFDFAAETSSVTVGEVGVGWYGRFDGAYGTATWQKTVFSRMVLPTTLSLISGQKMRMYYSLRVSFAPTTPNSFSAIVTGWPVAPSTSMSASQMIQRNYFISYGNDVNMFQIVADGTGTSYASQDYCQLEPWGNHTVWISSVSRSINNYGTASSRTAAYATHNSRWKTNYETGSYTLTKVGWFNEAAFPRSDIRSMGMAYGAPDWNVQAFTVVFDEPQTKTDTQTLTLGFKYTWRRVLTA